MPAKALLIALLIIPQVVMAGGNVETVERFIEAYNQHDVEAMLELSAPDIRWMSVSGQRISVQASDRIELGDAMASYFTSIPEARAELLSMSESGAFVNTLEEAFWSVDGIEKSQCSLAVYEVADDKIKNVWYFPAHQCE